MPYISPHLIVGGLYPPLFQNLGQPRIGKVRDTYNIPGHPDLLLVVASDRMSIYDFVLGTLIPDKGYVLTATSIFWFTGPLKHVKNHLVAYGSGIDQYLPEALRGNRDLQRRAIVVRRHKMLPVECIVRGCLTGSGWRDYEKGNPVSGHMLRKGYHDGSILDEPLFTPSTKAEFGHDEPLPFNQVIAEFGQSLADLSLEVFKTGAEYARERGIVLADTKFEFGRGEDGGLVLCDEVLTPDSSRFWGKKVHAAAALNRKAPEGYDKEPTRQYGRTVPTPFVKDGRRIIGINNLHPGDPDHQKFAGWLVLPDEPVKDCTTRYGDLANMLFRKPLGRFQREDMGVAT